MKELERTLSLPAVIAISISAMLGSGIFVLPGLAAQLTGPSVWLAYLVAGFCVLPAALCKAELATAMPTSGGSYVYIERSFGPLLGTVAGLMLWLSLLLKSAFALLGFGAYFVMLTDVPLQPTALVLLVFVVLINIVGVRQVGRAQLFIVTVVMAALAALAIAGLMQLDPARLSPSLTEGGSGLLAATALVFVSYNGVTKVAAIAEEVKNPGRNVPLGILLSLFIVMALYALVAFTLVGNVSYTELGEDLRPIAILAETVAGPAAGIAAAILGVVTMTSMANAGLLAASRFPFAMSRDNLLPAAMSSVSPRFKTPTVSVLSTGFAMMLAIIFLDVESLAKLASAIVIALYVAENIAIMVFREAAVQWYKPEFRAPLYPWLQVFGVLSGIVLLVMLGPAVVMGAALVVVPGIALFLLYGRRRAKRTGVVGKRTKRAHLIRPSLAPTVSTSDGTMAHEKAAVAVLLFGEERSPETLIEAGVALAGGDGVLVTHMTELPEQVVRESALVEEVPVRSLRRRVAAMAEDRQLEVSFRPTATRDIAHTAQVVMQRSECEWAVLEWQGRARTLLPYNPLGWLINHLPVNLALFKDAGIRHTREILVYAEPGPHDALVMSTAEDLANLYRADLTLVRFVPDNARAELIEMEEQYLAQLQQMSDRHATLEVLRGKSRAAALIGASAAYDLLVMGAPDVTLLSLLRPPDHERIIQNAGCSVLTVKTPRVRTHEAFARKQRKHEPTYHLPQFVLPKAVAVGLDLTRKESLFQYVAQAFSTAMAGRVEAKAVLDALWERERTQNTSVGHGVALPHATVAEANHAMVGIFVTRNPMNYQGPDDEPVDVFIVTLCPPSERHTHLVLLSEVARLSLQTNMLERLRAAEQPAQVLKALQESVAELG